MQYDKQTDKGIYARQMKLNLRDKYCNGRDYHRQLK